MTPTPPDFEAKKVEFQEYYASEYETLRAAKDLFRSLIGSLLSGHKEFSNPVMGSRLKDRDECIRKFERKYRSQLEATGEDYTIQEKVTDLVGVRVTCYYETDVPHISKILHDNFEVVEVTDKTSAVESRDDVFGYKGLHLDLKLNDERKKLPENYRFQNLRFEVQIRTIIQNAWSELDHKIKYKKSPPAALKRKINRLAALFELADQEFVNIKVDTEERERAIQGSRNPKGTSVKDISDINHFFSEILTKYLVNEDPSLDAFQFLSAVQKLYKNYDFKPFKVDGFVQEIKKRAPSFTQLDLQNALDQNLETVKKYADFKAKEDFGFNPYTQIRHALYLSDREKFASFLFERQKATFEEWLKASAG